MHINIILAIDRDGDDNVPDVPQAVQELLLSLFTSVYNHQDEEGRCFSDSLAELPEYDENDGIKYDQPPHLSTVNVILISWDLF